MHLRQQVASPRFQAVLPHFGIFMAIGVILRFPLGSLARVAYLLTNQAIATVRLVSGHLDLRRWREMMRLHSPLVLLFAALPGIGTFSYLASGPVLANRLLVRVAVDAILLKLPWRLYERTGLRRLLARSTAIARESAITSRKEVGDGRPSSG
jgi:hypothetical protein